VCHVAVWDREIVLLLQSRGVSGDSVVIDGQVPSILVGLDVRQLSWYPESTSPGLACSAAARVLFAGSLPEDVSDMRINGARALLLLLAHGHRCVQVYDLAGVAPE
jgi:hypothetical protein